MSAGAIQCAASLLLIAALPALICAAPCAYAQDTDRPLTIADCPKGYVLGVEDSDQTQPLGRRDDYVAPRTGPETVAAAQELAASPHVFITGCIPPSPPTSK